MCFRIIDWNVKSMQANEKTVINCENITLVVDLTDSRSPLVSPDKRGARDMGLLDNGQTLVAGQPPSLVKPIRKEELREKSQIVLEHVGTVEKSTRKLCSGSGVRTVAIKRTSQRLRKLLLPENEDEPKVSRNDTRKVESEDEASTLSGNYGRKHGEEHISEFILPDWSHDVTCDLCERGPSLSLGAWFCWCCGAPSQGCTCSPDELW